MPFVRVVTIAVVAAGATLAVVRAQAHVAAERAPLAATPGGGESGFDRERLWSAFNDWEPVVAADPLSPYVYQLTTRLGGPPACPTCGKKAIIFRRSRDGGTTWERDTFLFASTIDEYDPQIRVARDGTVDVAFLQSYKPGVTFMRSSDHGSTWSAPVTFTRPHSPLSWNDRPSLAISASGRDIYIGFNHSDSWIVASHDGGRVFGRPVQTSHDHRYYFHSAGAVAPDGSVTFAAQGYTQNYHGDVTIDAIHSKDGGSTWQTTRVDIGHAPPGCRGVAGCYLGFLGPEGGLASDVRGTLLLAYNINLQPHAPQRLFARTSSDGQTWSERVAVSGSGAAVNNTFPGVAAGPHAGDFRIAWMDDETGVWNAWYLRFAAGAVGAPFRLSNRSGGAPYKDRRGFAFPYGDYLGIAVGSGGRVHAIWGAGPSYNGPGGTWYTRGQADPR